MEPLPLRRAHPKTYIVEKAVSLFSSPGGRSSLAFGSDFALLTFKSAVDGKCDGQAVPSDWGSTIYTKEGGVWKALFGMGSPAAYRPGV